MPVIVNGTSNTSAVKLSADQEVVQSILLEQSPFDAIRPILTSLEAGVNRALPRRDWDMLMRKQGQDLVTLGRLHDAWSRVQERIAEMQLVAARTKEVFNSKAKEARQTGAQPAAKHLDYLCDRCDAMMEIFRDAADMLSWAAIAHQEHTANRVHRRHDPRFPSDQKLSEYVMEARTVRAENPGKFVLVSDLGTLVNVGDLVVVGPIPPPLTIEFVELKAGEKNKQLGAIEPNSAEYQAFGEKDQAQVRRLHKQRQRLEDVQEILTKDEGVDRDLGVRVKLYDPPSERRHWVEPLRDALSKVRVEAPQRFTVDGVLYVQVSKGHVDHASVLSSWLKSAGLTEGGLTFDYRLKRRTPLAGSMLADPFDVETRLNLILGETVILIHVVPDGFIRQLSKTGLKAGWESRARTDQLKKQSPNWKPFEMDHRAIYYGLEGVEPFHFGDMWLIRIVFDLVQPSSVAEWQFDMARRAKTDGLRALRS